MKQNSVPPTPTCNTARLLAAGAAFAAATWAATSLLAGLDTPACATAAVAALCAFYWVTEAIPIPATSILPFALLPLLGVLDHKDVAKAYGHHLILLLLGGFILSKAVESSGAHRRLALGMVSLFGRFGRRGLVLGFMAATALGSMWISNTATVLMLLPIAQAVLSSEAEDDLELPLLLGIAYAASIGGIGTPIGTPPNLMFNSIYEAQTGRSISFLQWMAWGVPIVLVFVPLTWLVLARRVRSGAAPTVPSVGVWRSAERRVLIVFGLTALAWVFRAHPAGGWSTLIGLVDDAGRPTVGDETVALAAVSLMFLLPSGEPGGARLLDWQRAKTIPWDLLLLFGGGLAIARAFEQSGLSNALGSTLDSVVQFPALLLIAIVCLTVTFMTEVTSNTATTALLMPILCAAGIGAGIDPQRLMVPAAISASCAFMMPVATAPNAIVFGTGRVPIRAMARTGVCLNLIGVVVISIICWLLVSA